MPRGLVRTDLNTTEVDYLNGFPVDEPLVFGTPVVLPHNFGNPATKPQIFGNPVTWVPSPAHFGNIFGGLGGVAVVTITSAQLKTLNSPMLIVPGRVGYVPLLEAGYMVFNPGSNRYTVGANDEVQLYVGDGTDAGSLINYTGTLASNFIDLFNPDKGIVFFNPSYMSETPTSSVPSVLTSKLSGSGLYLIQYNSTENFPQGTNWTGGNGTLKVVIEYQYVEA